MGHEVARFFWRHADHGSLRICWREVDLGLAQGEGWQQGER